MLGILVNPPCLLMAPSVNFIPSYKASGSLNSVSMPLKCTSPAILSLVSFSILPTTTVRFRSLTFLTGTCIFASTVLIKNSFLDWDMVNLTREGVSKVRRVLAWRFLYRAAVLRNPAYLHRAKLTGLWFLVCRMVFPE